MVVKVHKKKKNEKKIEGKTKKWDEKEKKNV